MSRFKKIYLGLNQALLCLWLSIACANASESLYQSDAGLISIDLPEPAQEAIDNGIPLTFVCEFALRKNIWLLSWATERESHQFIVSHHALSNRYMVRQYQQQRPKIFRSLTEAMNYIATMAQRLFNQYAGKNQGYQMRLSLSKYELPGPMRLNAFISSNWDLDTGWLPWTAAN